MNNEVLRPGILFCVLNTDLTNLTQKKVTQMHFFCVEIWRFFENFSYGHEFPDTMVRDRG